MNRFSYHPDHTLPLNDEIFVFGSNEAGRHGAGAARVAYEQFGAKWGDGIGPVNQCYAIPTKDENIRTLPIEDVLEYVCDFLTYALMNPELMFFMTRVGCGLAGFEDSDIAPMFELAPTNIIFPEEWKTYLEV